MPFHPVGLVWPLYQGTASTVPKDDEEEWALAPVFSGSHSVAGCAILRSMIAKGGIPPLLPFQRCHPDRSEAKWRDLRFPASPATPNRSDQRKRSNHNPRQKRERPGRPVPWTVRPASLSHVSTQQLCDALDERLKLIYRNTLAAAVSGVHVARPEHDNLIGNAREPRRLRPEGYANRLRP